MSSDMPVWTPRELLWQRKTELDPDPKVVNVRFDGSHVFFDLDDGRIIGHPISWSLRLEEATDEQRARWIIDGSGTGVHWPDVDEDISVRVLMGHPS